MPTRLFVRLQIRKSAVAGVAISAANAMKARYRRAGGEHRSIIAQSRFPKVSPYLIGSSRHRPGLPPVNEYGAEIVDIGIGWSRLKQIAQAFEESGGVVFGKKRGGIEAKFLGAGERRVVNESAGWIVWIAGAAIGTVGVAGDCRNPGGAMELLGERESIFLIRTAAALAPNAYSELAARHNDAVPPLCLQLLGQPGLCSCHVAGFALDSVAEKYAVIAQRPDRSFGGPKGLFWTSDEAERGAVEGRILRLGRFIGRIGQSTTNGLRDIEPEPRHHGAGIRKHGRVWYRWSRTDHRRIITRHIRDGEGHHPCRMGELTEPPAFNT